MIALFCACIVISLGGCTEKKTDATIILDSVSEVLDNFTSLDTDTSNIFMQEMDIYELENIGLNTTDFMKAYLDGFSYEIKGLQIDGNSAQVELTIAVKSFSAFESTFASEVTDISNSYVVIDESTENDSNEKQQSTDSELSEVTTDEMNNLFSRAVINCMKETPLNTTDTITITYEKNGNTWSPSPTAIDDIWTAMIDN